MVIFSLFALVGRASDATISGPARNLLTRSEQSNPVRFVAREQRPSRTLEVTSSGAQPILLPAEGVSGQNRVDTPGGVGLSPFLKDE